MVEQTGQRWGEEQRGVQVIMLPNGTGGPIVAKSEFMFQTQFLSHIWSERVLSGVSGFSLLHLSAVTVDSPSPLPHCCYLYTLPQR
jgi:hypothetical protein